MTPAVYVFTSQPDGTIVVSGGTNRYALVRDGRGGWSCDCPGHVYSKRTPKTCKHVREHARQQAVALTAAELEHVRADGELVDEFPEDLLASEAPPNLDAVPHADGEPGRADVDVPPLDLIEEPSVIAATDEPPLPPPSGNGTSTLAAAIERDLAMLQDRIDARLYRITQQLESRGVPTVDPLRRWWQRAQGRSGG